MGGSFGCGVGEVSCEHTYFSIAVHQQFHLGLHRAAPLHHHDLYAMLWPSIPRQAGPRQFWQYLRSNLPKKSKKSQSETSDRFGSGLGHETHAWEALQEHSQTVTVTTRAHWDLGDLGATDGTRSHHGSPAAMV